MKIGGPLDLASFEHVTGSDPVADLFEGRQIYRTDIKTPKIYQNGAWAELGSGSGGSGEINYVTNPDGELGVADWNEYSDAPGAIPVDGTGGTAGDLTLTATTVTAEIVRGNQTFKSAKAAANGQGQGFSTDIVIDSADKNKLLKYEFEYWTSSSYVDNDIAVFIYDVDNATLITPSDNELLATAGTDADETRRHSVQWNSTDSTNYRAIIHTASVNAAAYDLYFDNVIVGPGLILTTPAVTESQLFTPNFTGSSANPGAFVHGLRQSRVGNNLLIEGFVQVTTVAPGSGSVELAIPDGLNVDTTLEAGTSSAALGTWHSFNSTEHGNIFRSGTTLLNFSKQAASGAALTFADLIDDDFIQVKARIPILEWRGSGVTNALSQSNLTETSAQETAVLNSATNVSQQILNWARFGDRMHVSFSLEYSGIGDSSDLTVQIPSGLTIDGTKIPDASLNKSNFGTFTWSDAGTRNDGSVNYESSTTVNFIADSAAARLQSDAFAGGDTVTGSFSVPISEWAGTQNSLVGISTATGNTLGLVTSYAPIRESSIQAASGSANVNNNVNLVAVTAGGSNKTITLPLAANSAGRKITITKVDSGAGNVVVTGNGAETINGLADRFLLTEYHTITVECTGTEWLIENMSNSGWELVSGVTGGDFVNDAGLTISSTDFEYRQVGDSAHLRGNISFVGTGTDAGSLIMLDDIMGSFTWDISSNSHCGFAKTVYTPSTEHIVQVQCTTSSGGGVFLSGITAGSSSMNGNEFGNTGALIFTAAYDFVVRVNEWIGQ